MPNPEIVTLGHLDRTAIADLGERLGQVVRACGWLAHAEAGAATTTEPAVLADHTGTVRLRLPADAVPTPGSAVDIVGTAAGSGGLGRVELIVDHLSVVGHAEPDLPLDEGSTLDQRLDWRHLDLRRPEPRLMLRVQTTFEHAMRAAWADGGFIEIHSPKLIPTGPRPDELFHLDYFGRRAWLAQSPQFYKQMAMAAGLERVFEIGPVFRAEPVLSPVHATEFTSVDMEMSWIDSHEDVMAFAEDTLCRAVETVLLRHGPEIANAFDVEVQVPTTPFPRVTLARACEIVGEPGQEGDAGDLSRDGERQLASHAARQHGHQFVWISEYPESARPFFHMRSTDGSPLSRSFDLLWNGIEVASGAQREHRHDRLIAQAQSRGVPLDPIRRFLDFFRYGCPPHGGLGLGLSRMLMCLLGLRDIREATFLSRDRERLAP